MGSTISEKLNGLGFNNPLPFYTSFRKETNGINIRVKTDYQVKKGESIEDCNGFGLFYIKVQKIWFEGKEIKEETKIFKKEENVMIYLENIN